MDPEVTGPNSVELTGWFKSKIHQLERQLRQVTADRDELSAKAIRLRARHKTLMAAQADEPAQHHVPLGLSEAMASGCRMTTVQVQTHGGCRLALVNGIAAVAEEDQTAAEVAVYRFLDGEITGPEPVMFCGHMKQMLHQRLLGYYVPDGTLTLNAALSRTDAREARRRLTRSWRSREAHRRLRKAALVPMVVAIALTGLRVLGRLTRGLVAVPAAIQGPALTMTASISTVVLGTAVMVSPITGLPHIAEGLARPQSPPTAVAERQPMTPRALAPSPSKVEKTTTASGQDGPSPSPTDDLVLPAPSAGPVTPSQPLLTDDPAPQPEAATDPPIPAPETSPSPVPSEPTATGLPTPVPSELGPVPAPDDETVPPADGGSPAPTEPAPLPTGPSPSHAEPPSGPLDLSAEPAAADPGSPPDGLSPAALPPDTAATGSPSDLAAGDCGTQGQPAGLPPWPGNDPAGP